MPFRNQVYESPSLLNIIQHMAVPYIFMAQNQVGDTPNLLPEIVRLLHDINNLAASNEEADIRIRVLATLATAQYAQKQVQPALDSLQQALSLAEPDHYIRAFLDLDRPMAQLLIQAQMQGILPHYTGQILAAFSKEQKIKTDDTQLSPAPIGRLTPVEPLNKHELKVLRCVAAGLSNKETARELNLSVNTVKWYLKSTYSKLNAHNRVEAVTLARELGLL